MPKRRMPKYSAARDLTDKPIREALRECGCYVKVLSAPGVPDLAVWNFTLRRWFLIDCKTGKVKKSEKQTWDEDIEPGAVPFCPTIEEALDACGVGRLWRASVGGLEVETWRRGNDEIYITDVTNTRLGAGLAYGRVVARKSVETFAEAKLMHERMKIAAMNHRDFGTPFETTDPVPFEALHPDDADPAGTF